MVDEFKTKENESEPAMKLNHIYKGTLLTVYNPHLKIARKVLVTTTLISSLLSSILFSNSG